MVTRVAQALSEALGGGSSLPHCLSVVACVFLQQVQLEVAPSGVISSIYPNVVRYLLGADPKAMGQPLRRLVLATTLQPSLVYKQTRKR
jgi:hypothetical protein